MAEITLARARDTDRLVVLKKLHPRLAIEPEYIRMFHDEADIASRLHHPNLVEVYELGADGDDHYIAMEYLHGHDLSCTLRRMRRQRIPLLFQHAIAIVRDVAAGLHYAHERIDDHGELLRIIHRDVSPHNVFLTFSGEVKVVDFGIAKASSQTSKTRTGVLKGKTAYMSPEQAMGEPLDRRTDVFSIGILLWELTTGRWLYRRRSELETLKAVVEMDAPAPSSVRQDYPRDLERVVMKALARAPDDRWQTAGELRAALDDLARAWQFRPSAATIAKLLGAVFPDEVDAWEDARARGVSLAEHLVATVRDPSPDDRDDLLETDPEDGLTLDTRLGPPEPSGRAARTTAALSVPRARAPGPASSPWWRRHRVALAIGAALAAALAGALALSGDGPSDAAPTGPGGGSAGSAPPSETLQLVPAAAPPALGTAHPTGPRAPGGASDGLGAPRATAPAARPAPQSAAEPPRSRTDRAPPRARPRARPPASSAGAAPAPAPARDAAPPSVDPPADPDPPAAAAPAPAAPAAPPAQPAAEPGPR
jgi:serine/threonine-protein kinase